MALKFLLIKALTPTYMVKNLPAMWETWVRSLSQEDALEKGMATHSSILAWRIPWKEKPIGLQSMGSQTVRHGWATKTHKQIQKRGWSPRRAEDLRQRAVQDVSWRKNRPWEVLYQKQFLGRVWTEKMEVWLCVLYSRNNNGWSLSKMLKKFEIYVVTFQRIW